MGAQVLLFEEGSLVAPLSHEKSLWSVLIEASPGNW